MNTSTAATKRPSPAALPTNLPSEQVIQQPTFGAELATKVTAFSTALPKHIPQERFARVIMTAVQRNPDLLKADRQSLWNSAMQAAADGLLPDGREGALVVYNTKDGKDDRGRDVWIKKVQWLPMIAGIRKKVRNSGAITDWTAQVVHANDEFEYELGDDPFIKHKPLLDGDRGPVIAAYSVATLKGGEKSREVMTRTELDKVKGASKSPDSGPWKTWFEEMCRKSVAKRHAKVLPMSTDLDDLLRRDDELYDLRAASDRNGTTQRLSLGGKLDALAEGPGPDTRRLAATAAEATHEQHDLTTGEVQHKQADPATGEVEEQDDDNGDGQTDAGGEDTNEEERSPREILLHDLRGGIMRGESVLKLLNTLSSEQSALLTADDKKKLKEDWRTFAEREAENVG